MLKINGTKVTKISEVEVGGTPEAIGFSPDGKYLYVGNFSDGDMSILKVDGTKLVDVGSRFKLEGHPAALGRLAEIARGRRRRRHPPRYRSRQARAAASRMLSLSSP